jgi:ABC-2 type transport system permease protein
MNEVFQFVLPGTMYFWILFIGQGPLQEVLSEKEANTLSRLLASPVTLRQFLLSKMIRCFLLCAIVQTVLLLLSGLGFGMRWGNPAILAVVVVMSAWSMMGLLALIYSLARTREQANSISSILILGLAMLGGSMFPFEQLPAFLQAVGQFTPNRWSIVAFQSVMKAKPLADLVMPLGVLAGVGFLGGATALCLFQRQLLHRPGK